MSQVQPPVETGLADRTDHEVSRIRYILILPIIATFVASFFAALSSQSRDLGYA